MNPSVADRKLAWILPAAVSVAVVASMLLFPYASGYGLGSDPLWRLLLTLWNASDEWKHGMFVFPIAAVLLFLKRTELAKVPIKGSNWGLLLIVPSLFLYWVGFVANVQYIGYLAIQLMLGGCVVWFLGVRFFKAVFFIWCFLFFAYPFIFLEDLVAFPLRLLMSEASVRFLNLIGFHSIRDGTAIISAADPVAGIVSGQRYSVDVADPCSGIRSLFALTMISALVGISGSAVDRSHLRRIRTGGYRDIEGEFCRDDASARRKGPAHPRGGRSRGVPDVCPGFGGADRGSGGARRQRRLPSRRRIANYVVRLGRARSSTPRD